MAHEADEEGALARRPGCSRAFQAGWDAAPRIRAEAGLTTPASDLPTQVALAAMVDTWPALAGGGNGKPARARRQGGAPGAAPASKQGGGR